MEVVAWKNGKHRPSSTYGLHLEPEDRDRDILRCWGKVIVILPRGLKIEANVNSDSFWKNCPHLKNKQFSAWFYKEGLAPWPYKKPPKFHLEWSRNNVFTLSEI